MFRGIVLGDLWGIDEGVWVQLWSGTVGAIVSAGVAALVAVLVLTRSNAHQRKLAAEAAADQRVAAEKQLLEQRQLSERQLDEQRKESARVREMGAIAGVITALQDLAPTTRSSLRDVRAQHSLLHSAIVRWQLELGRGGLGDELNRWAPIMLGIGTVVCVEESKGSSGDATRSRAQLNTAIGAICTVGMEWQRATDGMQSLLIRGLGKQRREIDAFLKEEVGISS